MGKLMEQEIARASRESAADMRKMAKIERERGNAEMAAEDERLARAFDAKARRNEH